MNPSARIKIRIVLDASDASVPKRRVTDYRKDRGRKHHSWLVTVTYSDNETFGRVYVDHEEAEKFAARQKKSTDIAAARAEGGSRSGDLRTASSRHVICATELRCPNCVCVFDPPVCLTCTS
jgi:hypothetical protein